MSEPVTQQADELAQITDLMQSYALTVMPFFSLHGFEGWIAERAKSSINWHGSMYTMDIDRPIEPLPTIIEALQAKVARLAAAGDTERYYGMKPK